AFSPDGKWVVSDTNGAAVWSTDSGQFRTALNFGLTNGLAFRPDGKALVYANTSGGQSLWDVQARQKLREWSLPGHGRVAFASDGRHVVSGNANGTVYVLRLGPPAWHTRPWAP